MKAMLLNYAWEKIFGEVEEGQILSIMDGRQCVFTITKCNTAFPDEMAAARALCDFLGAKWVNCLIFYQVFTYRTQPGTARLWAPKIWRYYFHGKNNDLQLNAAEPYPFSRPASLLREIMSYLYTEDLNLQQLVHKPHLKGVQILLLCNLLYSM